MRGWPKCRSADGGEVMRNSTLVGFAVGATVGMMIAAKSSKIAGKVVEAEDAVKSKITEMTAQQQQD